MKRADRAGWASTDQLLRVAVPTPEPVEPEGPWEARTVMGKKGAGTGHPSLLPPMLPSLASTSRWPEHAPGSQQAGSARRCSLQGRPVCRVRAGGRHWGLRDSGEPPERTQPGTTPRDPQGPESTLVTQLAFCVQRPLTFRSQAPGEQGRESIENEKKKKKLKGQMARNQGLAAPQVVLSARQLRSREEGPSVRLSLSSL